MNIKKRIFLPAVLYIIWLPVFAFVLLNEHNTASAVKTQLPLAVQTRDAGDQKIKTPQNNVWYYLNDSLLVPAGTWRLHYSVIAYSSRNDTGTNEAIVTLSTTPTGETDRDLTRGWRQGGNLWRGFEPLAAEKVITLTVPTTYYLLVKQSSGKNWESLQFLGGNPNGSPTIIRAERLD
jgi:hypothetical protein